MPLRDHFHPPLSNQRSWHSFHNAWAYCLSAELNQQLPKGWFAQAHVQFNIEIDVAAIEEGGSDDPPSWSPPGPALITSLAVLTDSVEVRLFSELDGLTVVGAVELVSPANKDRASHREAFVTKCASLIQEGVGVVVVDVVTQRRANLHAELLARLGPPEVQPLASDLIASAYRPYRDGKNTQLAVWEEALEVGSELPFLPLFLKGGPCVRLDLETAYERAWREQGMPTNGVAAT